MPQHDLVPTDVEYPSCGALHFAGERAFGNLKKRLRLQACFTDKKVQLPLQPLLELLHNLLILGDRAVC